MTLRVIADFFSIFVTITAPTSAVFATCVPPQGCRSTPSISSTRMRPWPRGGITLMLRTSCGLASSSASLIQRWRTGWAAATSRAMPSLSSCLSSGSFMWKSSRA